jgi:hypothetical protein
MALCAQLQRMTAAITIARGVFIAFPNSRERRINPRAPVDGRSLRRLARPRKEPPGELRITDEQEALCLAQACRNVVCKAFAKLDAGERWDAGQNLTKPDGWPGLAVGDDRSAVAFREGLGGAGDSGV